MAKPTVSETPTPLRVAMEARDHGAFLDALAPGVVLNSPIIDTPFRGRDEVGDLFAVVMQVFEDLTYTAEVPGPDIHILNFQTSVKGTALEGVDLLRFDDAGKVKEMTVFLRPFPGIAAFIRATGGKLAGRRGGRGKAIAASAGAAPLTALMNATARSMPGLLSLGRDQPESRAAG